MPGAGRKELLESMPFTSLTLGVPSQNGDRQPCMTVQGSSEQAQETNKAPNNNNNNASYVPIPAEHATPATPQFSDTLTKHGLT